MKKIYTSAGCVLLAMSASAQAPFVNAPLAFSTTTKHQPNGITFIDMRDAANHYQDRTIYYTENFDAGFNGWTAAIQNGPVGFEITNVGHANDAGSTFVIPALLTSTPTKWVLLDSDSDGSSGQQEDATLTSPVIDLTVGGTVTVPANLKVEFEQFYAGWESDTLFLAVSDDGGSTWDEVEIMNNGVGREGRPNPEIVSINVSPYITDPSQVVLRMRWTGNWDYGWQFDNVTIAELPANDMKVTQVFHGDLVNAFMYSQVPQNQAIPLVIGADVKNIGYLSQTNIAIQWEVFSPSMASLGSGTSSTLASLSNGQNDTIWVNTGITPTALGNYTISVTVVATATDDDNSNNLMTNTNFWLTEYTYAADYGNPSAAFYNWANNNDGACAVGNIYTIENDGPIGSITARLDNSVNVEDQIIFFQLYKFDGSTYAYEAITGDYTTTSADNGQYVTLFLGNTVNAAQGDAFLAMACHYGGNPSAGFEMAGRVAQGAVAGLDETAALVSLIDPSAPVVRMNMLDYTGTEELELTNKFEVYPNPASASINVSLTLKESQNTVINVLDITGKVVKTINVGNVNGDKNLTISLDEMNNGVYFIELVNEGGVQVKKFIKQ